MKNIDLLFRSQSQSYKSQFLSIKNKKKCFQFKNNTGYLDGKLIKKIVDFFNHIEKKKIKLPIILDVGKVKVADKLSYIILECIVYKMIESGYLVTLKIYPENSID